MLVKKDDGTVATKTSNRWAKKGEHGSYNYHWPVFNKKTCGGDKESSGGEMEVKSMGKGRLEEVGQWR